MNTSLYVDALMAQKACIWEVTARKPGNVHRHHDFSDTSYLDFLVSAAAIGPILANAWARPVGEIIFDCACMVSTFVRKNTNLGIILLFAPLAKAATWPDYRSNVEGVLADLTVEDARWVYAAIRQLNPGGLGSAPEQDVRDDPTVSLREAMRLAADRDSIARQYADGYRETFELGLPAFLRGMDRTQCIEGGIIYTHLELMSRCPDTLIARKCGREIAEESALRAARVLALDWPDSEASHREIVALDRWLREDGHRRNPGTTADLVAATLFVWLLTNQTNNHLPWDLAQGAP